MAKKTKKQKLLAQIHRLKQISHVSVPQESVTYTLRKTHLQKTSPHKPIPHENKEITTYIYSDLKKTGIVATLILMLELFFYWLIAKNGIQVIQMMVKR